MHFHQALKKYGAEAFVWEILSEERILRKSLMLRKFIGFLFSKVLILPKGIIMRQEEQREELSEKRLE
jgi:hypothetical protein